MEIEFFGANCFRLRTKKTTVVFDDNLENLGAKPVVKDTDTLLYTQKNLKSTKATEKARLVIDSPGEFEVGDLSIKAVQTRAHMDEDSEQTATVYQCIYGNTTVTFLGHIHPDFTDEVSELASGTDVLVIPVGGNGYTLDAVGATSVIKKLEPEVVIPSQFEAAGFKFEVPPAPLEEFVKVSALVSDEKADSYRVDKPNTELANPHLAPLNIKK